jgi:pentatricopeptide repeat protein
MQRLEQSGLVPNDVTYNTLILVAGKAGCWTEAHALFKQLQQRKSAMDVTPAEQLQRAAAEVKLYFHMLTVLYEAEQWQLVIDTAAQGHNKGLTLCHKSTHLALKASSELGSIKAAHTIMAAAESNGTQLDAECYGALLMTYWRAKEPLSRAAEVIAAMRAASIPLSFEVYGVAMMMHADAGDWSGAEQLLQQYAADGLEVTAGTYNWLLSSCSRQGLGVRALRYVHELRAAGIDRDVVVYNHAIRAIAARNSSQQ